MGSFLNARASQVTGVRNMTMAKVMAMATKKQRGMATMSITDNFQEQTGKNERAFLPFFEFDS